MNFNSYTLEWVVIGALILAYGLWELVWKKRKLKSWIRTTATIDNIRRDSDGNVTVRVKYADEKGKSIACTLPFADGDRVGLGSEVEIAYNPGLPTEAIVAERSDMNIMAIGSFVLGAGAIAFGLVRHFMPIE